MVENGTGTILDHADVRRMLLTMKADTTAARGIALMTAVATDMANATGDAGWRARAAFLTPITKAFGTDTGIRVADLGIQVHGGMGYIEETGAAQFARDVRVCAIYEGTNGIQAMDLVGRKLMDGGEAAYNLLDEIERQAEACTQHPARSGRTRLAGHRKPARGHGMDGLDQGDERALRRLGALPDGLGAHSWRACAPFRRSGRGGGGAAHGAGTVLYPPPSARVFQLSPMRQRG
jgi:hypothetical protein